MTQQARIASCLYSCIPSAMVLLLVSIGAKPAIAQCPGQWIPGQQSIGTVRAFVTMSNGDLYAGGDNGVFRWSGIGWNTLPGITGTVHSLISFNGDLVAGGGGSASGVRRWDGQTWTLLGPATGVVYAMTVFNDELVRNGGGGNPSRWDGTNWQPIGTPLLLAVQALTVYNGSLIAAGFIQQSPGTGAGANGVGIWDGTAWHSLGTCYCSGGDNNVRALVEYNGDLFAGGQYSSALLRWNGTAWQNTSYSGNYIASLTVFHGDLVAGSGCNCPTIAPYLRRLHNGAWQPLVTEGSQNGAVNALASRGDDLFVGGLGSGGWGIYRTTCPRGDLNADGLVNNADQTILIDVLLNIDADTDHISRADVNGDGHRDGLDIAAFTACRIGTCP